MAELLVPVTDALRDVLRDCEMYLKDGDTRNDRVHFVGTTDLLARLVRKGKLSAYENRAVGYASSNLSGLCGCVVSSIKEQATNDLHAIAGYGVAMLLDTADTLAQEAYVLTPKGD